jgi:hypothetical protein
MVGEFLQNTSDSFNGLCAQSSELNSETSEEMVAKLPSIIKGYEHESGTLFQNSRTLYE